MFKGLYIWILSDYLVLEAQVSLGNLGKSLGVDRKLVMEGWYGGVAGTYI